MQYLGGKSRIAKQISKILNENKRETFVSLFCGACSIESLVEIENKILNDQHSYLIAMLQDLQNGRLFPEEITEDQYRQIKDKLDEDKGLSGFVGFGCSFGGKWWGGYARQKKGLNYALTAKRSLSKKLDGIKSAKIYNRDYRSVEVPDNSLVYCDPPYKGTTAYSNSKEFDHEEFWNYCRELSKNNLVFISEISAPEDFIAVWSKDFTRNLDASVVFTSVEKLFVHESNIDKIHNL